jgi:hypothetical protein
VLGDTPLSFDRTVLARGDGWRSFGDTPRHVPFDAALADRSRSVRGG